MALCPTLTVVEAIPVITLVDKGFAADDTIYQDACSQYVKGKAVQLALRLTADKNAYADININYTDPAGVGFGFAYRDTVINAGTANYLFTTNDYYEVGTYTLGTVNISNIRTR